MAGEIEAPGVLMLHKSHHLANQEHNNNDHEKQAGPATADIIEIGQQGCE
jgi:hypothetical protein